MPIEHLMLGLGILLLSKAGLMLDVIYFIVLTSAVMQGTSIAVAFSAARAGVRDGRERLTGRRSAVGS